MTEPALTTWCGWMVRMSWQVALLTAVVWVISRAFRRAPANFRYLLWLIVFVKLVTPPMLGAPWSAATLYARFAPREYQPEPALLIEETSGGGHASVAAENTQADASETGSVAYTATTRSRSWVLPALALWAAGAAGLFLVIVAQYIGFKRKHLSRLVEAPESIELLVAEQSHALGIGRDVAVKLCGDMTTPAVTGVWRPVIILPAAWSEGFAREELARIIGHELAHLKRGDILMGWLTGLLTCVYWFHPAVWVASINLRREREMACDDMVLRTAPSEGGKYAATIVRVAEGFRTAIPAGAGFMGLFELSDNLLHRIRAAGDETRPRRMSLAASLGLVIAALLLLPMAAWSGQAAPAEAATGAASAVNAEIAAHYAKADPDVQEYIKWTAETFGRSGLWMPENAFDGLSPEEREKKVTYCVGALEGNYGRPLCPVLAEAGALKDKRLVPGVLKAATYHREDANYDCRPKWMAVAALGRLGDESGVPALIPLVDHGNQNTKMWARASLVRLTGENFGADKQAWGKWWNATGKTPQLDAEALKPWQPLADSQTTATAQASEPPKILSTSPTIGARDVDPATTEIRITFDQDMGGGFSWTGGGPNNPQGTDAPRWEDARTCVRPVKLEAGKFYRVGINSKSHRNFKGKNGMPAEFSVIYFTTKGASEAELAKLNPPKVVKMTPENGAAGIPSTLGTLTVQFDQPMGGGFSWTYLFGKELYPETAGDTAWNLLQNICTLPVKLEPNRQYKLSLNAPFANNFQSANGVPLAPTTWEFKTGD